MLLKKSLAFLFVSFLSPVLLIALPQDLEIFTDFENVSGEGTIFIGEEPNVVTLIGFTVETLEDPAQLHSGTIREPRRSPWDPDRRGRSSQAEVYNLFNFMRVNRQGRAK